MRFRLKSECSSPGIRQRSWTKNGARGYRSPRLVLTERDGFRDWSASRCGHGWVDDPFRGTTAAQGLRETAAELIAMAEEIERRDRLDAKAAKKARNSIPRDGTSEVSK